MWKAECQIGNRPCSVHAVELENCLRDVVRVHLVSNAPQTFDAVGVGFELTVTPLAGGAAEENWVVKGFTDGLPPGNSLSASSYAATATSARRTRPFSPARPADIILAVLDAYPNVAARVDLSDMTSGPQAFQFAETDLEFAARIAGHAMCVDTGVSLCYQNEPIGEITLSAAELGFGLGAWEFEAPSLAAVGVAQGTDPFRVYREAISETSISGDHPDLERILAAVRRRGGFDGPPALVLIDANDSQTVRRQMGLLAAHTVANAVTYRFRCQSTRVQPGVRINLPPDMDVQGPLIAVETRTVFRDGDLETVCGAVPEPLAGFRGIKLAPPCDRLSLGVVVAGDDPDRMGRVPVALLWSPGVTVWARPGFGAASANQAIYRNHQEGEQVVVGFPNGSLGSPVIIGSLYNASVRPPEARDAELLLGVGDLVIQVRPAGLDVLLSGESVLKLTKDLARLSSDSAAEVVAGGVKWRLNQ